jgi:GPH family glycoside/pentoside/hexuronide:cation symporter
MNDSNQELPLSKKIWYGVGYLPDSILNNIYGSLIFMVYNVELGLTAAAIGMVGLIIRLWDAFNDPFIGNLSDKTRSRWGRRHPYIISGTLSGALSMLLFLNPPQSLGATGLWWYLLIAAFLYYTAFSIYSVPFFALGLGMSSNEKDRAGLMGWRVAANNLVLCAIVPIVPMLIYNGWMGRSPMESLSRIALILAALITVTGLLAARFLPKSQLEPGEGIKFPGLIDGFTCVFKNRPFLIATGIVSLALFGLIVGWSMIFYLNLSVVFTVGELAARKAAATQLGAVTGFAGAFTGMVIAPFVATLSNQVGRKRLLTSAIGLMILSYLLTPWLFTPVMPYLQVVFNILFMSGITCVFVLTAPMVGEVCDVDEIDTGFRREGIFTAMFNLGFKISIALTSLVSGLLISGSGFNAELLEQTDSTVLFLRWSFALVPVIFFVLCLYLNQIYPLNTELINRLRLEKITKR